MIRQLDLFFFSPFQCCVYSYIQGYVVIMMVEFGEYGFIKWKFKFWNFLSENLKSEFSRIFWWLLRKIEEVSILVNRFMKK